MQQGVHYISSTYDTNCKSFMQKFCFAIFLFLFLPGPTYGQPKNKFAVIAYYAGKNSLELDSFSIEKLTHIIFSFCHLKGNRLQVDDATDTAVIQKMVGLKQRNPELKVLL